MNTSPACAATETRYELRFTDLFNPGRGYAFPCNAQGQVELDSLSDKGRTNYFYARFAVGMELSRPCVGLTGDAGNLR
jgi:hypothetical protein